MTITVASAALDTTWVEFGTVSFTTSTLATMSMMIDEVASKLKRGTILSTTTTPTAQSVQNWIVRGKEELVEIKNFTFSKRYVTTTTTADTYRYSLPNDYNGGDVSLRDITNHRYLIEWPSANYDLKYPDPTEETSDEPSVFCIKNMELWLMPPAGGTYTLELTYRRSGDDAGCSVLWLPEIERFRCCDFATAEAFYSLHDFQKGDAYYNRWAQGLGKAVRADGKRKWKSRGFQAISCLQEHYAYRNQP